MNSVYQVYIKDNLEEVIPVLLSFELRNKEHTSQSVAVKDSILVRVSVSLKDYKRIRRIVRKRLFERKVLRDKHFTKEIGVVIRLKKVTKELFLEDLVR